MLAIGFGLMIGLTGCASSPCETAGRKEFQKQHPDYTILDVQPDGNDVGVTYVASFTKPNDKKTHFAYVAFEDNKTRQCKVEIHEY
jgi:hypothetical protein